MNNKRVYFKELNNIGDLYLVSILFEFDSVPIIFICKNKFNEYYICNLINDYKKLEWLICEISFLDIFKLIWNESDVLSVYLSNKYLYHITEKDNVYIIKKHLISKYKKSEIPEKDLYLDLTFTEINNILNELVLSNDLISDITIDKNNDNIENTIELDIDNSLKINKIDRISYDYSIAA